MNPADIDGILAFARAAERLKVVKRSGWTSEGEPESVAEHTWRLCLLAVVLHQHFPGVDIGRLLKICVIHDLGEAIHGDVPAIDQTAPGAKAADERRDLATLIAPLTPGIRAEILALWDEYEAASTPEGKLAKALDKVETIIQHNQGDNPPDFDYRFNLRYGSAYTDFDPLVSALRARLDIQTEARAREAEQRAGP